MLFRPAVAVWEIAEPGLDDNVLAYVETTHQGKHRNARAKSAIHDCCIAETLTSRDHNFGLSLDLGTTRFGPVPGPQGWSRLGSLGATISASVSERRYQEFRLGCETSRVLSDTSAMLLSEVCPVYDNVLVVGVAPLEVLAGT